MDLHAAVGEVYASWAHGRLTNPESGFRRTRDALGTYVAQGNRLFVPYFLGLRAELEAETKSADVALALIDEGLGISQETGERISDSFLHRLRGDILFMRDPANLAPAEEAFQTAIAIAKEQAHGATRSSRPSRLPNSTNPPPAPRTPTPSLRLRSKAFRRRRKCQRSPRRRRWLSVWCRTASAKSELSASRGNASYPPVSRRSANARNPPV
jgi:hypothetical protein